jgi:hypothetical protein
MNEPIGIKKSLNPQKLSNIALIILLRRL